MGKVKRLTLERYEYGLLEWEKMLAEGKPTEDIEDLLRKVIDCPLLLELFTAQHRYQTLRVA